MQNLHWFQWDVFSIQWLWELPPCENLFQQATGPRLILTQLQCWLHVGQGWVLSPAEPGRVSAVAGDGKPTCPILLHSGSIGLGKWVPMLESNQWQEVSKGREDHLQIQLTVKEKGKGFVAICHSLHNLLRMINEDNGKYPNYFSGTKA